MLREPEEDPEHGDGDDAYSRASLALWIFIVAFFSCLVRYGTFWFARA